MTSTLTKQWLRQNILAYHDRERLFADAINVLDSYSSLRPKTDVFTFNDGRTQLLLCLHGLVPITFKSAQYNIPIAIWCPTDYPRTPPMAYVVPTLDMLVRPSPLVELDGSLTLPYLDDWRQKPEGCTLAFLIEAMQDLFSHQPPLYSKPKSTPSARDTSPIMQLSSSRNLDAIPPTLPPKPIQGGSSFVHSSLTQPDFQQSQHRSLSPRPSPSSSQPAPRISNPSFPETASPSIDPVSGYSGSRHTIQSQYGPQPPPLPPHQTRPDLVQQQQYRSEQHQSQPYNQLHDRSSPVPPRPYSSVSSTTAAPSPLSVVSSPSPYLDAQQPPPQPSLSSSPSHSRSLSHPRWHPSPPPPPPPRQEQLPPAANRVGRASDHLQYTHPLSPQPPPQGNFHPSQVQTVPPTASHSEGQQPNPPYPYYHPGTHGPSAPHQPAPVPQAHTTPSASTLSNRIVQPPIGPGLLVVGHPNLPVDTSQSSQLVRDPARQLDTTSRPPPPNLMDAPDDDDLGDDAATARDDRAVGSEVISGNPSGSTVTVTGQSAVGGGSARIPRLSPRGDPTVPPRPPNPELLALHAALHQKLAGSLATLSSTHDTTLARLRAIQRDLLSGEPAIRDEMARLEAVRDVCSSVVRRLSEVVSQTESRVEEMRRKGEPVVDELVCSSDVVYNQVFDLIAEDNAIEDTIYHLHRALNAGRIDLERFIRTTRALAEEQFMKRALVEKIVYSSQGKS